MVKYRTEKEKRFAKVFESFAKDIYKVCLYLTKDEKIAQEVAEQTFVIFYDYFERVPVEKHRVYMIHIAKTLAEKYSPDKSKIE